MDFPEKDDFLLKGGPEAFLGPLALGDVPDEDEGSVELPVADGNGGRFRLHRRPVELEEDFLLVGKAPFLLVDQLDPLQELGPGLGTDALGKGPAQQLVGGPGSEEADGGLVEIREDSLGLDDDRVGRALDELPEPLLALPAGVLDRPLFPADIGMGGRVGDFGDESDLVLQPAARRADVFPADDADDVGRDPHGRVDQGADPERFEVNVGEFPGPRIRGGGGRVDHPVPVQGFEVPGKPIGHENGPLGMVILRPLIKVDAADEPFPGIAQPEARPLDFKIPGQGLRDLPDGDREIALGRRPGEG